MPTVSFDTLKTEPTETPEGGVVTEIASQGEPAQNPASLVPAKTTEPDKALAITGYSEGAVQGEISRSDISLPRLRLVQRMSKTAGEFPIGALTMNNELAIAGGVKSGLPQSLKVVVFKLIKQFQRKTEFGTDDEMPEVYNTEDEVRAVGGSLEWGHPNYFQPIAHIDMMVGVPEGTFDSDPDANELATTFMPFEWDNHMWGRVVYTAASTNYTAFAKPIITAFTTFLPDLHNGIWEVTPTEKPFAKGTVFVAKLAFKRRLREDELEFFNAIRGH